MHLLRRWLRMKNDVLVFLDKHFEAAKQIYCRMPEGTKTICIGGISGCGKTEVAFILSKMLNDAEIWTRTLSLDQYYNVAPEDRRQWRKDTGAIGPEEINWELVCDRLRCEVLSHYDIIIVEGLYACGLKGEEIFKVSLRANSKEAEAFRIDRGKEDEHDPFRKIVVRKETKEVELFEEHANLILEV